MPKINAKGQRTMKKLISLLLIVCIICPLLSGCVDQDSDLRMKKAYLRQFKIKDVEPEDVVIDYDGGIYNGARIVMLDAEWHEPQRIRITIDNDIYIYCYDSNTPYVYKYGHFFSFTDAILRKIISREDAQSIASDFNENVKDFSDTCDKHDFDLCEVDLEYYNENDKNLRSDAVMIKIDNKIIEGNTLNSKENLADYINTRLGKNIVVKIGLYFSKDDKTTTYKVIIKDFGLKNLPQCMTELTSVPGLVWIGCYSRTYYPNI